MWGPGNLAAFHLKATYQLFIPIRRDPPYGPARNRPTYGRKALVHDSFVRERARRSAAFRDVTSTPHFSTVALSLSRIPCVSGHLAICTSTLRDGRLEATNSKELEPWLRSCMWGISPFP